MGQSNSQLLASYTASYMSKASPFFTWWVDMTQEYAIWWPKERNDSVTASRLWILVPGCPFVQNAVPRAIQKRTKSLPRRLVRVNVGLISTTYDAESKMSWNPLNPKLTGKVGWVMAIRLQDILMNSSRVPCHLHGFGVSRLNPLTSINVVLLGFQPCCFDECFTSLTLRCRIIRVVGSEDRCDLRQCHRRVRGLVRIPQCRHRHFES